MTSYAIVDETVTQGDTKTITYVFKSIDLSTADFFMTVKTDTRLSDSSATIKKEPTDFNISYDGTNTTVYYTLTSEDTKIPVGVYYYDVQIKYNEQIFTIFKGTFTIVWQATEREE